MLMTAARLRWSSTRYLERRGTLTVARQREDDECEDLRSLSDGTALDKV